MSDSRECFKEVANSFKSAIEESQINEKVRLDQQAKLSVLEPGEAAAKHQPRQDPDSMESFRIALQVMGHDGARLLLPALLILLMVASCAGLFVWSVLELQKIPAIPIPKPIEMPSSAKEEPSSARDKVISKPKFHTSKAHISKHAKPGHNVNKARKPARYSYQRSWWDPDDPTGGRVIRSDGYTTDYSWNK